MMVIIHLNTAGELNETMFYSAPRWVHHTSCLITVNITVILSDRQICFGFLMLRFESHACSGSTLYWATPQLKVFFFIFF